MPEPSWEPREQAEQEETVSFLTDLAGGKSTVTPTSRVFLVGDRAYKLKRSRVLPFLDYGSLEKRKRAALREVELNRRLAPALYDGVVPVTREGDGALAIAGQGAVIDWLVQMRRFDDDLQADRLAGKRAFTLAHAALLADSISAFHRGLAPVFDKGGASDLRAAIRGVGKAIALAPAEEIATAGTALAARLTALVNAHAALIDARRDAGRVRLCHGDMHLANIVVLGDVPVPFDCIEFSDDVACVDILFDLAFPVMDLLRYGLGAASNLLLNRTLAATDDYDGLALLPLFLAARALIRAMSEGLNGRAAAARDYLAVADIMLTPQPARLTAVGGLSGCGKSTVARALAPDLGPRPGAILLRSDEIRKRLRGVAPEERLGKSAYRPQATRRVFERMRDQARRALVAGRSVVLDATHMDPLQRGAAETLAVEVGVPFAGLWFDAPEEILLARVGSRTNDMSDAGADVVLNQGKANLGDIRWTRINATRDIEAVKNDARATLGLPPRPAL